MEKEIERLKNTEERIEAQKAYLKERAKKNNGDWMNDSFAKGIGFAPTDGVCYRCGKQIYADYPMKIRDWLTGEIKDTISKGISLEEASTELVTGCPHCHYSFVE